MHSEASKKTISNDYMDSDEYTMRNKSEQAKYESNEASQAIEYDSQRQNNEIQIIQNLIR